MPEDIARGHGAAADEERCNPDCPVARAHAILGGKWTTLIVRELVSGPKRYSALQRALAGISPRMLAQRLRLLEEHGLIWRRVYPTVPPQTEYGLSDLGGGLIDVIAAMARFGLTLPARPARAGAAAPAQERPG